MSKPTLKVTSDFTEKINRIVKQFKNDEVLVGVPQSDAKRKENVPINNATILAINEYGSPRNNIPARPVMAMGIRDAQKDIAEQFKKAAIEALRAGESALTKYYNRAGIIAANSIKAVINAQGGLIDGPIEAPAQSTLEARQAKGFKGTKALVVTGQLRNSITHVLRSK